MISAKLKFTIELPYEHEHYKRLVNLSNGFPVKTSEGLYEWTFPLMNLKPVIAVVNQPISFLPGDLSAVFTKLNLDFAELGVEPFKGLSGFEIYGFPDYFVVREYRKKEQADHSIKVVEKNNNIPLESVMCLWRVMLKYGLDKEVKTKTVAEHFCQEAGLIDYFTRESGSFDFAKFFGKRSKGYMRMYYPLKILEHYGCVKHHKYGTVERVADVFEWQTKL